MPTTEMTIDEIGDLAERIYEQKLRLTVETEANIGKIISIDVSSGDYAIAETTLDAVAALRSRHPDAKLFSIRIGYNAVYTIGGTLTRRVRS